jgi:hypothetical protein
MISTIAIHVATGAAEFTQFAEIRDVKVGVPIATQTLSVEVQHRCPIARRHHGRYLLLSRSANFPYFA